MKIKIHKENLNKMASLGAPSALLIEDAEEIAERVAMALLEEGVFLEEDDDDDDPAPEPDEDDDDDDDGDEKCRPCASVFADEFQKQFKLDPLDIESKQLVINIRLLDSIRKILGTINSNIAMLPRDPDAIAMPGSDVPGAAGEADVPHHGAARKREFRVVDPKKQKLSTLDELKNKVIENLKFLL